jgi:hypothetical protein
MSLGAIEAEIASIENLAPRERSLADIERLRDLREARQRITGGSRRDHHWGGGPRWGCMIARS